jgi:integrase/recombinase XerD
MPVTDAESWTVVDDDWVPVVPAERYLAHLAGIERSPNTVRAYAHGLRLWFEFLDLRQVDWACAGVEDVSRFVAWLRAPADNVIVIDDTAAVRSAATVNRHLAALFGFYDFHARSGVVLAADLVAWRRVSRGSYKPFLHHVTRGRPIATPPQHHGDRPLSPEGDHRLAPPAPRRHPRRDPPPQGREPTTPRTSRPALRATARRRFT